MRLLAAALVATYFVFDLPPVVAKHVAADNWQRSPWLERAPGIGALPSTEASDHFS
jgi:hypothetical protein